ncbi:MAG: non-ribosomal peptide synthetase, partial [Bryobacteraceae bacterium]
MDGPVSSWLAEVSELLLERHEQSSLEVVETAVIFDDAASMADLPLVLRVQATPGAGTQITADYDARRFADGAVARILHEWKTLIENIAGDLNQSVSAVSMFADEDLHDLLTRWNNTETAYPAERCIHEAFEEQADRSPDATAIIFKGRTLTYNKLDEKADQIAARLVEAGAGPDVIVGICIERSLEMMPCLLGILKAGAAYLPLDPAFPPERLRFMLEDSGALILLTERHLAERFREQAARIIIADPELGEADIESQKHVPSGVTSGNLAYVIYTSGSTGKPKGVMVEHRQVMNFFAGMDCVISPDPGVWLAVTSISFDISVLELFWTLAHGFTVIVQADDERLASGSEYSIEAQIERHGVTHLQTTPSMARLLAANPASFHSFRCLRKLIIGGEILPSALAAQLRRQVPGDVFNLYGPTETTIWSASYRVSGGEAIVPIGRPIANTQLYILDARLRPVPFGASGELFIGGAGVVRGYLNRPELTRERFAADPFGRDRSGSIYRTGDLARYKPNGDAEFLGRVDNQVKIFGFRIEPEEIEAVLSQHPAVQAAAVVPREDVPGEKRLAAYVLLRDSNAVGVNELRVYLQQRLPPHMVPSSFALVDAMPSTPNGKIDKKALLTYHSGHGASRAAVKTRGEFERLISGIWREALETEAVDIHDNFFDLGATSLMVAEVAASLSEALQIDLPLTDLFQYPTIDALAGYLSRHGAHHNGLAADVGLTRGQSRKAAMSVRRRTQT